MVLNAVSRAGVLSSYGELQHMRKGSPELLPFDPWQRQPKMSYKDGFQKCASRLLLHTGWTVTHDALSSGCTAGHPFGAGALMCEASSAAAGEAESERVQEVLRAGVL